MVSLPPTLAMFGLPGGTEWIVIAIFGLLLFGKRLPEVGKSLGKSIVEFKKGLKGIEDDVKDGMKEAEQDMLPPPSTTTKTETQRTGEPVSQTHAHD